MMPANFKLGDRVQLSAKGRSVGLLKQLDAKGTVVGGTVDGHGLTVLFDYRKSKEAFNVVFLEKCE